MSSNSGAMDIHVKWQHETHEISCVPDSSLTKCLIAAIARLVDKSEVENMSHYKLRINGVRIVNYGEKVSIKIAKASYRDAWILEDVYAEKLAARLGNTSLDSTRTITGRLGGTHAETDPVPARRGSFGANLTPDTVCWSMAGHHFRFVNREKQAAELLSAFCEMEKIRIEHLTEGCDQWELLK
jgi:hypothetical protein